MPADGLDLLIDGIGGEIGEKVLMPRGRVMDRLRAHDLDHEEQGGESESDWTEKKQQRRRHPESGDGRVLGDCVTPGEEIGSEGDDGMRERRGQKQVIAPKHQSAEFKPEQNERYG